VNILDPKLGATVHILGNVTRMPSRISFGPALSAMKMGYKVARALWIPHEQWLTMDEQGVIWMYSNLTKFVWQPNGQMEISAEDWVILDERGEVSVD
jgi:hypothetical protein